MNQPTDDQLDRVVSLLEAQNIILRSLYEETKAWNQGFAQALMQRLDRIVRYIPP